MALIGEPWKTILLKCLTKPVKYSVTKELGIKYCEELLESIFNHVEWDNILNESKKKDDLCDALLHAWVHLIGKKSFSKEFSDKIIKYFSLFLVTCYNSWIKYGNLSFLGIRDYRLLTVG